jgi:chorismate lyase/3-hydroxybenzoate synthase
VSGSETVSQPVAEPPGRARQLDVRLAQSIESPSPRHGLLVGFHFGKFHPHSKNPAVASLELAPLEHDCLFESWWYDGDVHYATVGAAHVSICADYSVALLKVDEPEDGDFQALTCRAYDELIRAVRSTPHPDIVKIWNYLGGINQGEDDFERYRQFSVGRAKSFRAAGIEDAGAPTGTAIGASSDRGLTLIALASRRSTGLTENPRQVSAYRYPRKYGPSSPKFSRGGFVASDRHRLFLISGTAAVIGHESAYPYDAARQTDETLNNLGILCNAVSDLDPAGPTLALDAKCALRVYLRDPEDFAVVKSKLKNTFGRDAPCIAFLQGNICRRELMVEIDGVGVTAALHSPGCVSPAGQPEPTQAVT